MRKSQLALVGLMSLLSISTFAANTNTAAPEKITLKMDFDVTPCEKNPKDRFPPSCAVFPDTEELITITLDQCTSAAQVGTYCDGRFSMERQSGIYTFKNDINISKHTDVNGNITYKLTSYWGLASDRNQQMTLEVDLNQDGKLMNSIDMRGATLQAPQPDGTLFTYQPYLRMYS